MTRFFLPSKLSIIPDIVQKDRLLLANSLTSTTMMIATIVGYGFGGLIVARLGVKGGFYVDSITYLISAFMLCFVTLRFKKNLYKPVSMEKISLIIKKTIFQDIKEGFIYLRGNREIRMVANTMFLIMAGVGSIYIIIIVFIQEALGSSIGHLGILAMFLGGGLLLGSLVYGRFGARLSKKRVINFGLFITGLIIVVFSLSLKLYPSFFIATVISTVLGICASPIVVSSYTLIHEVMVDEMRGRVFSFLEIITHIGFLVFMVLTSFVAKWINKEVILIIVGLVFSVIGLTKMIREVIRERKFSVQN